MDLSQVSRTAILTLITRVVVSEKDETIFNDPMAALCLEGLISIASAGEKNWITLSLQPSHECGMSCKRLIRQNVCIGPGCLQCSAFGQAHQ